MSESEKQLTQEGVVNALKTVIAPGPGKDIVTMGFVKEIAIEGKKVRVILELMSDDKKMHQMFQTQSESAIRKDFNDVESVSIEVRQKANPFSKPQEPNYLVSVKHPILVSSGKGGVGKSTVSVNLAIALAQEGYKVGLMDADAYGPSFPTMLNISNALEATEDQKIIPAKAYDVECVSLGFIIPPGTPVIWRGPMLDSLLKQFMSDVMWGELDYLIIDLPPGTGDVQLTLSQLAHASGALIVTTPQQVSIADVTRNIEMFKKTNVDVLGIIENMSTFVCPHCGKATDIFNSGGGVRISEQLQIPLIGKLPLNPVIVESGDKGVPITAAEGNEEVKAKFVEIAKNLIDEIAKKTKK